MPECVTKYHLSAIPIVKRIMKILPLKEWTRRLGVLALSATAALVSCAPVSQAAPDYDQIGKQFSLVLQNAHFSRGRFSQKMYEKFLESYLRNVDPQRLYFSEEDVQKLRERYGTSFGDYLLASETRTLAVELYTEYSTRALHHIAQAEKMLKEYEKQLPAFDSDRTTPRSRRKLPRAANKAALEQAWRDMVDDMVLTEVLRRENVARLAAEKGKPDPNANELPVAEKLQARLKRLRNEVQEADTEDMVAKLLNAVALSYDPHSDYMGAREEQRFKDMIKASIVGIGAQLREDDDGSTRIEGIVKGGPAAKNGQLKLGDRIVAVDSANTGNWTDIMYLSIDKVVDLIRGKKGVSVRLRVLNAESGEQKEVVIVRDEVPMSESLASAKVVDVHREGKEPYRVGILTLPSFYIDLDSGDVRCASDVKKLLQRMNKEGVKGLVVDLRFNGGGSLDEVRKMVGFFTGAGPVVQVRDSRGHIERLTVSGRQLFKGEVVVITNKLSASASEIFAGAMADYGRAVIVGDESTYGKGTVQIPRSLSDYMPYFASQEGCGMIKVTVQKFYRINGASTQLKGVESDIVLPMSTAALPIGEAEMDYAMPYDEIAPAGHYVKNPHLARILPELRRRSAIRVAGDKDLQYSKWFIDYRRRITEQNTDSLNKEVRRKEDAELRRIQRANDEERKTRYAAMAEQDARSFTIYRLTLDDVQADKLPIASKEDEEKYMESAEDPEEALEDDVDYPSNLDPILREALHIVRDMMDMR